MERDERDFLTARAKHWQMWSAIDYNLIEFIQAIGDPDDLIKLFAEEHRKDSRTAREYLFALIDMGRA